MKNRINVVLIFLMTAAIGNLAAQDSVTVNPYFKKPKSDIRQKLFFGGNVGLTLGTYSSISFWPMVGYKLTPKMSLGLQPGYEYLSYSYNGRKVKSNNYGVRLFNRFRFIDQAFTHIEFAYISYDVPYLNTTNNDIKTENYWVPFLFLGAGYAQRIGGGGSVYLQLLFDVINDDNSPYNSWEPFYTVGFGFGF